MNLDEIVLKLSACAVGSFEGRAERDCVTAFARRVQAADGTEMVAIAVVGVAPLPLLPAVVQTSVSEALGEENLNGKSR